MPLISFKNLGARGIITDLAANELPLDAWSGGKNVRFSPAGVERTLGNQYVYGTPAAEPLAAFQTAIGANAVWSYWTANRAYSTDGVTQYDITRATGGNYTVSPKRKWTGGNFNGLVVANNGFDIPQVWAPSSISSKATNMANWPTGLTCGVLRPFRNYLFAMDLTVGGVHKPAALRWSHPADPGSVPISWDIADQTKDAGEIYFNETSGKCVDVVSLRNDAIVYKTDAIYRMQEVGGLYIFKSQKISSQVGIPASRCAIEVRPGVHILWTGEDVLMFDGQQFHSIAASKVQGRVRNISDNTYESAFMVYNPQRSEVWLCWSEDESNPYRATTALIFNWITGAWGYRDLGAGFNFITFGAVEVNYSVPNDTWANDTGVWDNDSFAWGESIASRSSTRLLGGTETRLTYEDFGFSFNGAAYESYVERKALGIPFRQDQPPDISSWKFCREIWPRMSGDPGTQIEVSIGSMTEIGDTVTWAAPQIFTIGTDVKVNCTCSGRMFALKFRAVGSGHWALHGYDLEVQRSGGY